MAWRRLPILVALLMVSATVGFIACDDTGPSPIGEHAPDDIDSGGATKDAEPEAGDDDDGGEDAGEDSGQDDGGDAGKTDAGDGGLRDADADAKG